MSSREERKHALATSTFPIWAAVLFLPIAVTIWASAVSKEVPEPYLDEVFHVGQVQRYLGGNYAEWDPKITTPPGLYAISTVLAKLHGFTSLGSLRGLNAALLPLLAIVLVHLDTQCWNRRSGGSRDRSFRLPKATIGPVASPLLWHQLHTAANICLFPPLFFFTGLYYTDVASTFSVLIFWSHFIHIHKRTEATIVDELINVLLALVPLTFRQTNIFWVAIFPAIILLVSRVDVGIDQADQDEPGLMDAPIRECHIDDYLLFIISLIQRTYRSLLRVFHGRSPYVSIVRLLLPYVTVLAIFGAFVYWNGGVVLGDKSNHVATIHLAQLLYLWPYMTFFSLPLTYPYLLQGLIETLALVPATASLELNIMFRRRKILPRLLVLICFTMGALLIVHFNTIVHPFSLADNRHYTFYVFRILLRHPATKYIVAPLYIMCAWSVIQALGAPAKVIVPKDAKSNTDAAGQKTSTTEEADPAPDNPLKLNLASAGEGAQVSFVMAWLGTSALQLAAAPLVEPRYFIVPWIMWRLRVPEAVPSKMARQEPQKKTPDQGDQTFLSKVSWYDHDHRLWLETAWFLLINAVTGWMFLYKGFEWAQEPGKIQRFMW